MGMIRIHNRSSGVILSRRVRILPPPPMDIQDNDNDKMDRRSRSQEEKQYEEESDGSPISRSSSSSQPPLPHSRGWGRLVLIWPRLRRRHCTGGTGMARKTTGEMTTFSDIIVADNKDPLYFVSSSSPLLPIFYSVVLSLSSFPVTHPRQNTQEVARW